MKDLRHFTSNSQPTVTSMFVLRSLSEWAKHSRWHNGVIKGPLRSILNAKSLGGLRTTAASKRRFWGRENTARQGPELNGRSGSLCLLERANTLWTMFPFCLSWRTMWIKRWQLWNWFERPQVLQKHWDPSKTHFIRTRACLSFFSLINSTVDCFWLIDHCLIYTMTYQSSR